MDNLFPTNFKRQNFDLGVLFLISIIIVLPVFFYGIPMGADTSQHYQFAITFFDSVQNGNFYPSWTSATNHGFGDVGVRFYPPLAYYAMVGFRFLSGNWFDASVLTFSFWFFLGAVGLYFWCREWFGENASLAAAIVYIFMPYHVNEVYNFSLLAEFAAMAVLPFCFLFVTRICRGGKIIDVVGLAVFYALLVLTHLPMTVIGSTSLLIYSLASLENKKTFASLVKLASAVFAGLLASSFYWLKMISELNLVKISDAEFSVGDYDYRANFIFSSLNVLLFKNPSRSTWNLDLMLLMSLIVIVPSAIIFYRWSENGKNQKLFNVGILLIFSIFIASPFSLFVWDNLSFLQKVQFPWRWLAIVSLTSPVFVAAGFESLIKLFRTKHRPIALITFGLIFAGIVFTFTRIINTSFQMPRQEFAEQTKNLPNARSYKWAWTKWSQEDALSKTQKVLVEGRSSEIIDWQPTRREIVFSQGNSAQARIATFYYPHWKATVNNQMTELQPAEDGAMVLPLPPEKANVAIWFQEPFPIRAAFYSSAITWLIFGFVIIFYKSRKYLLPFKVS